MLVEPATPGFENRETMSPDFSVVWIAGGAGALKPQRGRAIRESLSPESEDRWYREGESGAVPACPPA